MGMISEFKTFAMKGNLVDLAVGFIIGGAFGTVVSSLVSDIIMPPVGMALGGVDFENLKYVLKAAEGDVAAVTVNYGSFINNLISFIIVALVMFFIIKAMNKAKKAEDEAPAAPPANEVLLAEIRDLLSKK